ncbi:MAG: GDP-mannose 4,6-dehydratase [Thermosulfidibacteraceae bacterium]
MGTFLLTGSCGFIGWKVAELLLRDGHMVVGVDNMNSYYDVRLKRWRLEKLKSFENFTFFKIDIENKEALEVLFSLYEFDGILNLAARAGVSYSIKNPSVYYTTNVIGTLNLLELAVSKGVKRFLLASTSSIYAGCEIPFREDSVVDKPISPYAASKRAAELLCYTYHSIYDMDTIILRYFTVYGPCGRPDMSIFRFIKWVDEGKKVKIYGSGEQSRDFTYVDDVAEGTIKALFRVNGFEIINIGGGKTSTSLNQVLDMIGEMLGKKVEVVNLPSLGWDIKETMADITKAKRLLDWQPRVPFEEGLKRTVSWYVENRDWLREISFTVEGEEDEV